MAMSSVGLRSPSAAKSGKPRVMIVDDSVVVRGLLSRWLTDHGGFDIIGTAANGQIALDMATRTPPDIIVLDLDMPVMDGITALPQLLKIAPDCSIVIASTLTRRNANLAMKCIALGAVEVIAKPESNRDLTLSKDFQTEIVTHLEGLAGANPNAQRSRQTVAFKETGKDSNLPQISALSASAKNQDSTRIARDLSMLVQGRPSTLVIGASTGGPRAISRVLFDLKTILPNISTLIVQHMPPIFTASFADQVSTLIGLPAHEPNEGETLQKGHVYIAPGGRHMGLRRELGHPVIRLDDTAPVRFCRPAVDVLFNDAAHILGSACVGVILTGMGQDGTDGAKTMRAAGAAVIAQDEESSVVWGMPGSIVKAGLASAIMPATEIGPALRSLFGGKLL
jgi:two-component system, chemotaxis family, protein-glutamate methylesterase/glutaminase